MPLNQLLMHVANCSNIYFNLSLFQYLDKHTIQNIGKSYIHTYIHIMNNIVALRPIDRKKNRKRNLISANVGLLMLGFMLVNVTIQCNLHIWELNLGRQFRYYIPYLHIFQDSDSSSPASSTTLLCASSHPRWSSTMLPWSGVSIADGNMTIVCITHNSQVLFWGKLKDSLISSRQEQRALPGCRRWTRCCWGPLWRPRPRLPPTPGRQDMGHPQSQPTPQCGQWKSGKPPAFNWMLPSHSYSIHVLLSLSNSYYRALIHIFGQEYWLD